MKIIRHNFLFLFLYKYRRKFNIIGRDELKNYPVALSLKSVVKKCAAVYMPVITAFYRVFAQNLQYIGVFLSGIYRRIVQKHYRLSAKHGGFLYRNLQPSRLAL